MRRIEQRSMAWAREDLLARVVRDLAPGVSADRVEGDDAAAGQGDGYRRIATLRVLEVEEALGRRSLRLPTLVPAGETTALGDV